MKKFPVGSIVRVLSSYNEGEPNWYPRQLGKVKAHRGGLVSLVGSEYLFRESTNLELVTGNVTLQLTPILERLGYDMLLRAPMKSEERETFKELWEIMSVDWQDWLVFRLSYCAYPDKADAIRREAGTFGSGRTGGMMMRSPMAEAARVIYMQDRIRTQVEWMLIDYAFRHACTAREAK